MALAPHDRRALDRLAQQTGEFVGGVDMSTMVPRTSSTTLRWRVPSWPRHVIGPTPPMVKADLWGMLSDTVVLLSVAGVRSEVPGSRARAVGDRRVVGPQKVRKTIAHGQHWPTAVSDVAAGQGR